MSKICCVKSALRTYTVELCDLTKDAITIIADCDLFFIDKNIENFAPHVWEMLKDKLTITLIAGEETKSIGSLCSIYEDLVSHKLKRSTTACVIGGGTIQDISGFVCSTFMRGISWVYIPTTFVSQSDSCVGGKTSINVGPYKNLVGTFYPPSKIYIDPNFVSTQSELDLYNGIGEMVKICIAKGQTEAEKLAVLLPSISKDDYTQMEQLIRLALSVKVPYVEEDEYDVGTQQLLNYGHCFGHALEAASGYSIPHGQAVLLGIWAANILSNNMGILDNSKHTWIVENLILPALKIKIYDKYLCNNVIIDAMMLDKKRCNEFLSVILLSTQGILSKCSTITHQQVIETLRAFYHELKQHDLIVAD